MFVVTKNRPLATTITGSLPRPSWYTTDLHGRSFSIAMGKRVYREQYTDAVQSLLGDQSRARSLKRSLGSALDTSGLGW